MSSIVAKFCDKLSDDVGFYVQSRMEGNDASHDFKHLLRALSNANEIMEVLTRHSLIANGVSPIDVEVVVVAVLLHDVADHKYLKPNETEDQVLEEALDFVRKNAFSEPKRLALVKEIITNVSFSQNKNKKKEDIPDYAEFRIVQDADRIDAIGLIGVGRAFTFAGSRNQTLQSVVDHFDEKLVHLMDLMHYNSKRALERHQRMADYFMELKEYIHHWATTHKSIPNYRNYSTIKELTQLNLPGHILFGMCFLLAGSKDIPTESVIESLEMFIAHPEPGWNVSDFQRDMTVTYLGTALKILKEELREVIVCGAY